MVKGPVIQFSMRPVPEEELERLLEEHVDLRQELFANIQEIEEIVGKNYEKMIREYVTKRPSSGKKRNNGVGLKYLIQSILEDSPEGLTKDQIAATLLLRGYKTSARDFPDQCYHTMRRQVVEDRKAGLPDTFWWDEDTKVWKVG